MDSFDTAEGIFATLRADLTKKAAIGVEFYNVEEHVSLSSRELIRNLLQGYIDRVVATDLGPEVVTLDDKRLTHKRKIIRKILTRYGEVSIERTGYSSRHHEALFPHDATLNLPSSRYSYCLQKFVAKESSKGSFDCVIDAVKELFGIKLGKQQAIKIAQQCSQYFDAFYAEPTTDDEEAPSKKQRHLLILTTDAKGVIMRAEGLREQTRKRQASSNTKKQTRLSKGEKSNAKRMAQVASLYFVEPYVRSVTDIIKKDEAKEKRRPKPLGKKVWASLEKSSAEVIDEMVAQAVKLDPDKKHSWAVLVDGQTTQINQVKSSLKKLKRRAPIILDIVHAIEYLWKAAYCFHHDESSEAEAWVSKYLEHILNYGGRSTARSIRMSAAKRLTPQKRNKIQKITSYFADRDEYTSYKKYLKQGYPIGTGIIEGACRYLIKDRMDITGARWGLSGAEAILRLRTLIKNDDFEKYWQFYINQEHIRLYENRFNIPKYPSQPS